jgi:hypothetical protein
LHRRAKYADVLIEKRLYSQAKSILEVGLTIHKEEFILYEIMSKCYIQQANFNEAFTILHKYLNTYSKSNSSKIEVYLRLGMISY